MKREFFNPAHLQVVRSRRIFGSSIDGSFRSACYKSQGGAVEDEDEDAKEELLKEVQKRTAKAMEERGWRKETIESFEEMQTSWKTLPLEAIRALTDEKTGIIAKLAKVELVMESLENSGKNGKKDMSVRAQIERWRNGDNKESIDNFRDGKTKELPTFELDTRAVASPMTVTNTVSPANSFLPIVDFDYTLNDIPRFDLTFWNFLTKGRTSRAVYGWVNKTNPQGAAGFIGPGVLKPGISFEVTTDLSYAKKIAATDKVTTELLDDIDGMESWIKDELRYAIYFKINEQLMTGTGSATNPTGIQNLSVAYTTTTVATLNPTFVDAIRAAIAQVRAGKVRGQITVFINPIDSANMDIAKASTSGVYMLPPFVTANGKTIAGAAIVEDNNIPVGYFQLAMLQYYKILIYKPLVIDWGYENDDFTKNLITYRAEMRLHQLFNSQYQGAFIYDSFANVQAAISA